jgi:hypothetical protein
MTLTCVKTIPPQDRQRKRSKPRAGNADARDTPSPSPLSRLPCVVLEHLFRRTVVRRYTGTHHTKGLVRCYAPSICICHAGRILSPEICSIAALFAK